MTVLRDVDAEINRFRARLLAAAAFVLVAFLLLATRLVYLQVWRHEELATQAEANRIAVVPVVPNRGLIVDRNGIVLASNYSAYTLEIASRRGLASQAIGDLDTLIDALATVVEIGPRDRRRFKRLQEELKGADSLPIRTKLSDEEVARFTAQRFRFPGVDIKARLFRNYPLGDTGSHLLGYIGRINVAEKQAMEDWDEADQGNYKGTEYIGKLGLEQSYERQLHGKAGFEEVETSAGGRAVRRLRSHPPTPGDKLVLSIDIRLQSLVEQLFGDRRGALVAIDPRSGEVLAFVSKPTFDPNLFVDGIDSESWRELNESIDKPLLNRALRGTYPPGSTFKPFMAMAALNSGKRAATTLINDPGFFMFGGRRFGSPENERGGIMDMRRAIVESSNVYFYSLADEMGVDLIHAQLEPFGFGVKTGIDVEGEVSGLLPSTAWKKRYYKKPEQQRWYAGETISLGIGQGYNSFTMLQLADATATLVSGGQRFRPRLVREIENIMTGERQRVIHDAVEALPLQAQHTALIRSALHGVTQDGTSKTVFVGAPYASGGKTGTAQAVGLRANEKYNASKVEEHKRDHSLYIAAAPIDEPTVALAVVVENAGFGSEAAAPIARRVFRLPAAGPVAQRRRPGADAPGQVQSARRFTAPRHRGAVARAAGGAAGQRTRTAGRQRRSGAQALNAVFERASPWPLLRRVFGGFDGPLLLALAFLAALGLVTMYSAGFDHGTRFVDHGRNMLIALVVMFVVAQVPPQRLQQLAVPLYLIGVALLVATAVFGITRKGATRWLALGPLVIQPSEVLKIAVPLMLAWWFQKREGQLRVLDFVAAGVLLLLPVALVIKQPDLGTALLILASGIYVIFFAGLSWKIVIPVVALAVLAILALVLSADALCQPGVDWPLLRDYQRNRVCTLMDPTKDPLGKGFHIIQGMIAIGSGGLSGRGFMQGTQTHLEFIPERTTDFIFAAFSEEFGLAGVLVLLAGFTFLILRGLMIAAEAPTVFTRLLAGAVTLSFFTYAFVNMGMVSGILPVVGVPLPFISYGGTAMVTLGMGQGILMSVARSRRLMQS